MSRRLMPEALLTQLADLVGKPVVANIHCHNGPTVNVHGVLSRVHTHAADLWTVVMNDDGGRPATITLPADGFRHIGRSADHAQRLVIHYGGARLELRDMSPGARLESWRTWVAGIRATPRVDAHYAELKLIRQMLLAEAADSTDREYREALHEIVMDVAELLAGRQYDLRDVPLSEDEYDDSGAEDEW